MFGWIDKEVEKDKRIEDLLTKVDKLEDKLTKVALYVELSEMNLGENAEEFRKLHIELAKKELAPYLPRS